MSFLPNIFSSGRRSELVRRASSNVPQFKLADHDAACFETYEKFWNCIEQIMKKSKTETSSNDSEIVVISYFEQLVSFISNDLEKGKESSACLDHFLGNAILPKVLSWCSDRQLDDLMEAIAKGIDYILAVAKKDRKDLGLMRDSSVNNTICQLFNRYEALKESGKSVSVTLESILVSISYYISVFIVREPSFLSLFYNVATAVNQPKFPLMTVILCNLYKNGAQGKTSRDNCCLLMSLAKEHDLLTQYIAYQSDFCPIVATGLSAVFSDLPRLLPKEVEEVGMLSSLDVESIKELEEFVTCLEFCDSILEIASLLIVRQLLDFCYSGFLVPVLGSALFQDASALNVKLLDSPLNNNSMKQILASTCYLTLCIKRIRHRGFIGIFVRFLLTHTHEDIPIIEFLIKRLSSQTELRLATLHLFQALIDLNCEDVMLVLVMKHLLPCSHTMVSQKETLQTCDTCCLWAAKFLSLVPTACSSVGLRPNIEAESRESSEPTSHVRSWANNDLGENRHVQLSFSSNEKKSLRPEPITANDNILTDLDCLRLRNYLNDVFYQMRLSVNASWHWTYLYNGTHPPITEAIRMLDGIPIALHQTVEIVQEKSNPLQSSAKNSIAIPEYASVDPVDVYSYCMEQLTSCLMEINANSGSPDASSGYQSFNFSTKARETSNQNSFFSKEVQDDLEFWSLMRDEDLDSRSESPPAADEAEIVTAYPSTTPNVGLFLETLIQSIDNWLNNSLEVNLALCSIVSRLAAYSQPLLRSLLLNPYLILQPSIPSLFMSLATLKQRIDSALKIYDNASVLVEEARISLQVFLSSSLVFDQAQLNETMSKSVPKARSSKFASLINNFVRRDVSSFIKKEAIENGWVANSTNRAILRDRSSVSDPIGSHVAISAVLLQEWLHELAGLCLEHSCYFPPCIIPLTNLAKR